jgi:hypothetical protein
MGRTKLGRENGIVDMDDQLGGNAFSFIGGRRNCFHGSEGEYVY